MPLNKEIETPASSKRCQTKVFHLVDGLALGIKNFRFIVRSYFLNQFLRKEISFFLLLYCLPLH